MILEGILQQNSAVDQLISGGNEQNFTMINTIVDQPANEFCCSSQLCSKKFFIL